MIIYLFILLKHWTLCHTQCNELLMIQSKLHTFDILPNNNNNSIRWNWETVNTAYWWQKRWNNNRSALLFCCIFDVEINLHKRFDCTRSPAARLVFIFMYFGSMDGIGLSVSNGHFKCRIFDCIESLVWYLVAIGCCLMASYHNKFHE